MGNRITLLVILTISYQSKNVVCIEDETETVNEDLFDLKNLIRDNVNFGYSRLLSDNKFDKQVIKNFGGDSDAVNSYEEITILDDKGELKNFKFKAAKPKIPVKNQNLVKNNDKVTDYSEKIGDQNDISANKQKPKFFDEIGFMRASVLKSVQYRALLPASDVWFFPQSVGCVPVDWGVLI
ncbi:jg17052 [Pararge aegeria aegeria]|uniref:Jg17052 protein n=1 Tax=Pararge aegeria aegeria TaxID=348720 RepID=A0A8S4R3I4_9NEOP|nr:jg17052 [Pararge aegeria aegeria]